MNQTINLDNAKRLAQVCEEKGVILPEPESSYIDDGTPEFEPIVESAEGIYPSPNTNELLEILPAGKFNLNKRKKSKDYAVYFMGWRDGKSVRGNFNADTPQDALVQLLVFLIENNLYTND